MKNSNLDYYLAFSYCPGIGPATFDLLLKRFGSVEKAHNATRRELNKILKINLTNRFIDFRGQFDSQSKLKELNEKKILVLTREDERFPPQLKNIFDPPICLYIKGEISSINFSQDCFFSVVGTRKPTSYGLQITRKLVAELANAGFVIVSGMAMGIDAVAHQTALDWGAKTVAVFGCGVDIIYPSVNAGLYQTIITGGGIVFSEFPPGTHSLPGLFISRNRLISGLSTGVLVIEGAEDSGALITAKLAAEQGRDVFATPAPITSEMSQAPNILLKNGAKLVTSIEDVLQEINMRLTPSKEKEINEDLDEEEQTIIRLLRREPYVSDDLVAQTKTPINLLLRKLSQLELKGLIEKNNEGKYQLRSYYPRKS